MISKRDEDIDLSHFNCKLLSFISVLRPSICLTSSNKPRASTQRIWNWIQTNICKKQEKGNPFLPMLPHGVSRVIFSWSMNQYYIMCKLATRKKLAHDSILIRPSCQVSFPQQGPAPPLRWKERFRLRFSAHFRLISGIKRSHLQAW